MLLFAQLSTLRPVLFLHLPVRMSRCVSRLLLETIIPYFGPPKRIVTDLGVENMNSEISQLLAHYNISHITSSRAHPQSNGLVERRQRMLLNYARLFTNDYASQNSWDIRLPMCLLILNSTKSITRRFSPFFLTFFRHARMPYHAILNRPLNYNESSDVAYRLKEADKVLKASADYLSSAFDKYKSCLLYTSPSPRDLSTSRMPSSA